MLELASSKRKLAKEIAKREAAEEAIRQKERRSRQLLERARFLEDQMRLLSRRILSVQEEERKNISRELHDVVAQMLTGINIRLENLRTEASANTKDLAKSVLRAQRLVEKSVGIVHRFARDLRPDMLDDLGLIPTLYSYMARFTKATGVRVSLSAFSGVEELPVATRTTLFRVVQEALTNVARHAHASESEVVIEKFDDYIRMRIDDNGRSFDVETVLRSKTAPCLGLLGMRERVEMAGGSFLVESSPGNGTSVQARMPLADAPNDRSSL